MDDQQLNRRLCWERLFIIIVLFGLLSTQAVAASFDCKKAASWLEKTVCSDPELSKLDDELAKVYHNALASLSPEGQKETRQYQRQWLKELSSYSNAKLKLGFDDSAGAVEHALKNAYKDRIKQLQQSLTKFPDRIFKAVGIDDSETDKTCKLITFVEKSLTYPQIENPRNENEKFWNHLISQKAIDKFKREKSESCTDIRDVYFINFNNKHLISLGGEHDVLPPDGELDYSYKTFFNWLLESKRELQASDLFDDKTDWRNKLTALVAQKKREQEDVDNDRYIVPDENLMSGLFDIDKITSQSKWMISKNGLVFQLYAWNMRRSVLITIDWKTLDPYLSQNGHSLIYD